MNNTIYLAHHGTKGMKWYHRLYQNKDGSLTALGRIHYGIKSARKSSKDASAANKEATKKWRQERKQQRAEERVKKAEAESQKKAEQAKEWERLQKNAEIIASKYRGKSFAQMLTDIDQARLKAAQERVEFLKSHQEKKRELAYLDAEAKAIKKNSKKVEKQARRDAVRDSKKKYSSKDISSLTDQELNDRIARLQNEIKLRSLEAQRSTPKTAAAAKLISETLPYGIKSGAQQMIGAKAASVAKKTLHLSQRDIDEFIRLTKKK